MFNRSLGIVLCTLGRGASYAGRSQSGSTGGLHTSENAGISSENYVRIIMAENLRFLGEGSSAQGENPKANGRRVVKELGKLAP